MGLEAPRATGGVECRVIGGERTNLGVDMGVLGVDMVNLRRRRNEGGERAKRERLAVQDALEGVSATVGLEAPRATGGVECRVMGGLKEVN